MTLQSAEVACAQCGELVQGLEEFCPVCGDFLGWRELPAPQPTTTTEAATTGTATTPAGAPADRADSPGPGPSDVLTSREDPLARFRDAARAAQEHADTTRAEAGRAQVRFERARRRSEAARRRVQRIEARLPGAQQQATEAEQAASRAGAAARRATSAARGSAVRGGTERDRELRQRAREATRSEAKAVAAALTAQAGVATLGGVLEGARAEVALAPLTDARRERDAARARAASAQADATTALAELALQERLLQLRATPRRVVAMPQQEQELREQAEREAIVTATRATGEAVRRAEALERRQSRRAEREDDRRSQAEQDADERELGEVLGGAGAAKQAAERAEGRLAGLTRALPPVDDDEPRAVRPVEVQRRVRARAVPVTPDDHGPVLCPGCAAGNSERRTLCRSCGVLLRLPPEPPPPPPLVWWRRLLRLGPPAGRPLVPAGARPLPGGNPDTAAAVRRARVGGASALRQGGRLRLVAPLIAVALLAAVVLGVVLTPLAGVVRQALGGGRDRVARGVASQEVLVPLSTRASSSAAGSTAELAVDGDLSTSWTAGRNRGVGERLGLTLLAPYDIVELRLTAAAGKGRPRPATITVHTLGRAPVVLRLADTTREQLVPVDLRRVSDLRIRIDALHPSASADAAAGLAEVVVVGRVAPRALRGAR